MLVVLDVSYCLVQIAIGADTAGHETVLNLAEEFIQHWYSVLSNDDSFCDSDLVILIIIESSGSCLIIPL